MILVGVKKDEITGHLNVFLSKLQNFGQTKVC
jgi:hypothetical protein